MTTGDVSRRAREDDDPDVLRCIFPGCSWARVLTGPTEQDFPDFVTGHMPAGDADQTRGQFLQRVMFAANAIAESMADGGREAYMARMVGELRAHLEDEHPEVHAILAEHMPELPR